MHEYWKHIVVWLTASDKGAEQSRKQAPKAPETRPASIQQVKESTGSQPASTVSKEELPSTDGSLFDF
ncbi:hypothetical protein [Sinobaca sp. H24]|uniref:hypothetical protein n=1 Tax=Sinobaca sp. H24 TaxID=2923376 RepID=UPI00207AE0AF|nr:hypothetical protein [Sinobaca sp. H24]